MHLLGEDQEQLYGHTYFVTVAAVLYAVFSQDRTHKALPIYSRSEHVKVINKIWATRIIA